MTNLFTSVTIKPLSAPAVATATVTSSALDVRGYPSVNLYVYYGDSADTLAADLYWTAKVQECATESGTYTDVAANYLTGVDTNAFALINAPTEDQTVFAVGYTGTQNYLKVVVTPTGTHSSGTPVSVFAGLGLPRSQTSDYSSNP